MADRIKGITIEIGGDTSKLSNALKSVNKDLKTAQNGLKDVDKLLEFDPGNIDLLRQKQSYLNDAIASSKEKLEQEKAALEQLKNSEGFDKNSEQAKALERQIAADEQALKSLQKEAKEFGSVGQQQFKLVGEKVKEIGKSITNVGKQMSMKVTAPIMAIGAASVAAFNEVDAGLDIIVTKTGATGDAFEGLKESYEKAFASLPTDAETVANAVGEINTRFGSTGDELDELTPKFIMFAELNGTDVANSVDKSQKALSAWGLGVEHVGQLLDVMNATGQATGVSMDALFDSLIKNGPVFQELGMSIDQAVGFLGQLEMSGADSSAVLSGLQKALKKATEEGKPLDQALSDLQNTIKNGTGATDGLTAAYDLFGKSGAIVYEAVKNGTIDFQNLSAAVTDASGSVENTFNATLDPIDKFKTMLNQAKIAGADLGSAIQEASLPAIEKLAGAVKSVTEAFRSLTPEQQEMIVKIGAIVAAAGPAIVILGSLVTSIGALIPVIGAVVGILTGPFALAFIAAGAAIGAIIVIGKALMDNWSQIKADAIRFKDDLISRFNELKENVTAHIEELKTNLSERWDAIKKYVTDKATEIKNSVTKTFDTLKTQIDSKIEQMKTSITNKFEAIRSAISDKINAAKEAVRSAIDAIKGFLNFHWELPHLAMPHFSVSGSANPFDWFTEGPPHINVEWYKKAYDNPVLFTSPTVMQTPGGLKGFGDGHGAEIVMGLNKLRELVGEGGDEITINVYGAQGQDVRALAAEVERALVRTQKSRSAVFA